MASISKLAPGKYYVQIRAKGKKSQYKSCNTLSEAKAWAKEQEKTGGYSHKQEYISPSLGSQTFLEIGLRYCDTVLNRKPSYNNTIHRVRRIAAHFT